MNSADQESFRFTDGNLEEAYKCISRYPEGRQASAVMPLLHLVQQQAGGFVPRSAIEYIAKLLSMRPVHVREVVKFYSMYNTAPVGKYLVQVCKTTPCWLRRSDDVLNACKRVLCVRVGETTKDNLFTLREVECLGACVNAPIVQINDDYYENLDAESMEKILLKLKEGNEG
ncbi:NADH-quinone oxidoreductase, E subunit [Anaplasma phagocytophilum str. CRT53-1]|uniref:NADH-quinone oxidoreductase subunit E n=2 Tax=Anaplasma phagocytophilum TaxID=948 RepID=A0A0F3Q079_ANAPH|nr:NADH-quinone oxidoreductase subunit NuoE [Anaplasma phagocytophilum]EOA62229.1 NADH dehydrogenase subunit E [Anaplasma phagocytophilum str. CRT38]KJV85913.1 NADH-quinone oxidoreductase, E subunit [Anaplasma phagocytophilum str. CRT53-1]